MEKLSKYTCLLTITLSATFTLANENMNTERLFGLTLEELLKVKVTSSTLHDESVVSVPSSVSVFKGDEIKPLVTKVSKEFADVYKGDYAHFTLKEISEQPKSIIHAGNNKQIEKFVEEIKNSKNLYITGSGSSYNAAEVTKYLMSKFTKININPIISSELPFDLNNIETNSKFIEI